MPDTGNLAHYLWLEKPGPERRTYYSAGFLANTISNCLSFYLHISTELIPHQKSFFSPQREIIAENYNLSKCRKLTVGSPAPINTSTTQPLHLWLKKHFRRGSGKTVRARVPKS